MSTVDAGNFVPKYDVGFTALWKLKYLDEKEIRLITLFENLIKQGGTIYFSQTTGNMGHFRSIAEKYGLSSSYFDYFQKVDLVKDGDLMEDFLNRVLNSIHDDYGKIATIRMTFLDFLDWYNISLKIGLKNIEENISSRLPIGKSLEEIDPQELDRETIYLLKEYKTIVESVIQVNDNEQAKFEETNRGGLVSLYFYAVKGVLIIAVEFDPRATFSIVTSILGTFGKSLDDLGEISLSKMISTIEALFSTFLDIIFSSILVESWGYDFDAFSKWLGRREVNNSCLITRMRIKNPSDFQAFCKNEGGILESEDLKGLFYSASLPSQEKLSISLWRKQILWVSPEASNVRINRHLLILDPSFEPYYATKGSRYDEEIYYPLGIREELGGELFFETDAKWSTLLSSIVTWIVYSQEYLLIGTTKFNSLLEEIKNENRVLTGYLDDLRMAIIQAEQGNSLLMEQIGEMIPEMQESKIRLSGLKEKYLPSENVISLELFPSRTFLRPVPSFPDHWKTLIEWRNSEIGDVVDALDQLQEVSSSLISEIDRQLQVLHEKKSILDEKRQQEIAYLQRTVSIAVFIFTYLQLITVLNNLFLTDQVATFLLGLGVAVMVLIIFWYIAMWVKAKFFSTPESNVETETIELLKLMRELPGPRFFSENEESYFKLRMEIIEQVTSVFSKIYIGLIVLPYTLKKMVISDYLGTKQQQRRDLLRKEYLYTIRALRALINPSLTKGIDFTFFPAFLFGSLSAETFLRREDRAILSNELGLPKLIDSASVNLISHDSYKWLENQYGREVVRGFHDMIQSVLREVMVGKKSERNVREALRAFFQSKELILISNNQFRTF